MDDERYGWDDDDSWWHQQDLEMQQREAEERANNDWETDNAE